MIISRVGPDLVFLAGCRMFFKEYAGYPAGFLAKKASTSQSNCPKPLGGYQ